MKSVMNVTVEEINPIKMMFVRQVNLQGLQAAFYNVINGALSKSVVLEEELKLIRIYHESFRNTPSEKVRMDIGVSLTLELDPGPEYLYKEIYPGLCVVGLQTTTVNQYFTIIRD